MFSRTPLSTRRRARIATGALVASGLLGLTGCGGSDAVATAAAANAESLEESADVRDFEVLSVYDGSITTLRDTVDGDRPVLVWFWAPH